MLEIQNNSYAKKVGLITLLLLVAIAGVASSQQTFDVTMTADNVYAIYLGDPVSATSLEGNATNLTAGDIWVPEVYNLVAPDISFVYIAAWSDDKVKQGLLADFDNLTLGGQVLSGDPIWEVTATGLNLGNLDPPPTLADLTAQIVLANAGSNPSGGWVTPTVSSADNAAGGIHGVTIAGIDANARWMWYDSGNDTTSANPPFTVPYVGFNHDEYLIFRIPVTAPEPATLAVLLIGGALALLTGRGRKKAQTRGDLVMKNRLAKHVPFVGLAVIGVAMFMGSWSSEAAAMPWLSNTSSFPIPGSRYDSQNGVMIGPEVEILSMSLVPKRGQVEPPPPGGSFQVDSFFDVFTELSLNGGASFSVDSFFDVFTELSITNVSTNPNDTPQQFDTEIISMSLTGDVGGTPVIIQALPSPGQTTITDLGGGQWEVDSFFDVFVEISVDGGPWMGATQSLRMPGTPEPATLAVLLIGGSLALLRRRA